MCECDLMCGWRKGEFHLKRCKPNRGEKCRSIYLECRKCNLEFFVCTPNNMARLCPCFFTREIFPKLSSVPTFFLRKFFFRSHLFKEYSFRFFHSNIIFSLFFLWFFFYIFPLLFSIKLFFPRFFPRFFPLVKRVNFICEQRISKVFFSSKLKTLWKIGHRLMIAHVQNILHLFCSTKFVHAEKKKHRFMKLLITKGY